MSGDATLFKIPGKLSGSWKISMPNTSRMKGMVIAAERLYVAGKLPGDGGELSHVVRSYSLSDGKPIDEFLVGDPLIHDCLAVAGGRVYVTTQGGRLICLGDK